MMRRVLDLYAQAPYHPGKWRVIEAALRMTGRDAADRGKTFRVQRAGLQWELGPDCAVQRRVLYHGALDVHDTRALLSRVGKGSVFFDVGSYFGYYAMLAARQGAEAFAFEPSAANFALLNKHREINQLEQMRVFQMALSDRVGTASFSSASAENRGRGHLAADGGEGEQIVTTTTLDAFATEQGISRLDAMKLDVEGAELKVIAGGRETLRRFRPVLLVEINPPCLERFGTSEGELVEAIHDLGYAAFLVGRNGLSPFSARAEGGDYVNVLCLPR